MWCSSSASIVGDIKPLKSLGRLGLKTANITLIEMEGSEGTELKYFERLLKHSDWISVVSIFLARSPCHPRWSSAETK